MLTSVCQTKKNKENQQHTRVKYSGALRASPYFTLKNIRTCSDGGILFTRWGVRYYIYSDSDDCVSYADLRSRIIWGGGDQEGKGRAGSMMWNNSKRSFFHMELKEGFFLCFFPILSFWQFMINHNSPSPSATRDCCCRIFVFFKLLKAATAVKRQYFWTINYRNSK